MGTRIAVVGATGNVGRELFNILDERLFPADEVYAIASRRSIGQEISYGDRTLKCHDLEQFDNSRYCRITEVGRGRTRQATHPRYMCRCYAH